MWNPFKALYNLFVRKKPVPPPPPPASPKPISRRVLMGLTVINNKSDKEYNYKSVNDFGLSMEYLTGSSYLIIKQKTAPNDDNWEKMALLADFSIIKYEFVTFKIEE